MNSHPLHFRVVRRVLFASALAGVLWISGCQGGGQGPSSSLQGKTRVPPPATGRRAVYVQQNDQYHDGVVPGSSGLNTNVPANPQNTIVPGAGAANAVPKENASGVSDLYGTNKMKNNGGWIPVPSRQSADVAVQNEPAKHTVKYPAPEPAESAPEPAETTPPRHLWKVVEPEKKTETAPLPTDVRVPGGVVGTSYQQRYPYEKIVPGKAQVENPCASWPMESVSLSLPLAKDVAEDQRIRAERIARAESLFADPTANCALTSDKPQPLRSSCFGWQTLTPAKPNAAIGAQVSETESTGKSAEILTENLTGNSVGMSAERSAGKSTEKPVPRPIYNERDPSIQDFLSLPENE